jgi:hypothetical protein
MTHEQNGQAQALDAVLEQFSRVSLPPDVESRLRARVERSCLEAEQSVPPSRALRIPKRWAYAAASLAAAAMLAAIFSFGSRDAWAQVAKSLGMKPWVRMTLQIPGGEQAPKDVSPEMLKQPPEIWFSPAHQTAGCRFMNTAQFLDFAHGERWRFEPKENIIYRETAGDRDQVEFDHLNTLLRLVGEENKELKLPQSQIEFIDRSQREVRDGDRLWTEFTFQCRDPQRTPPEFTTTLRVDSGSQLPVEMRTTEKFANSDKGVERIFKFDYPEHGPADIYDLGVARSTKVIERLLPGGAKELFAAHNKARLQSIEPYTAVVLMSDAQAAFGDIFSAYRVRYDGRTWQVAEADFDQLLALRQRVWSKELLPPQGTDPAIWWKSEVAKLTFAPFTEVSNAAGNALLPDAVGYYFLSDPATPGGEIGIDRRPVIGPPNTLLVGVRTSIALNSFWMDPEHDYAAVRFECPSGDKTFALQTSIIDTFEKSPGGRWYATQVRVGDVQNSGDEPRSDRGVAPVATSVYRHFVEFDDAKISD